MNNFDIGRGTRVRVIELIIRCICLRSRLPVTPPWSVRGAISNQHGVLLSAIMTNGESICRAPNRKTPFITAVKHGAASSNSQSPSVDSPVTPGPTLGCFVITAQSMPRHGYALCPHTRLDLCGVSLELAFATEPSHLAMLYLDLV